MEVENLEGWKYIGRVSAFFAHPSAAIIELEDSLKVDDKIRIKGHTTDFEQVIESMQIEHETIQEAKKGQSIGIKVKERTRGHDVVYKAV